MSEEDDTTPSPEGHLSLQTLSMPADTNPNGDIFAGWLMSQMDLAGAMLAQDIAKGRVTTVSVGSMSFLRPIPVGAIVSCYAKELDVGRASVRTLVEVWTKIRESDQLEKVTEGEFVFVAIDEQGRTRPVPRR